MKKTITIAGNIGVGKSTLVGLLCQRMGWQPFYEPEAHNPYLADFYQDMPAWSFHSQIFFLAARLEIHRAVLASPVSAIQDRSIYEDAEVFAANLHRQRSLNERDYATYTALYRGIAGFLPPPDLIIYLQASPETLARRIALRNREYERGISPAYLEQLNQLYAGWITGFKLCPVLTVPADRLDYVSQPRHLDLIERKIHEKLSGMDVVHFAADEIVET